MRGEGLLASYVWILALLVAAARLDVAAGMASIGIDTTGLQAADRAHQVATGGTDGLCRLLACRNDGGGSRGNRPAGLVAGIAERSTGQLDRMCCLVAAILDRGADVLAATG